MNNKLIFSDIKNIKKHINHNNKINNYTGISKRSLHLMHIQNFDKRRLIQVK